MTRSSNMKCTTQKRLNLRFEETGRPFDRGQTKISSDAYNDLPTRELPLRRKIHKHYNAITHLRPSFSKIHFFLADPRPCRIDVLPPPGANHPLTIMKRCLCRSVTKIEASTHIFPCCRARHLEYHRTNWRLRLILHGI